MTVLLAAAALLFAGTFSAVHATTLCPDNRVCFFFDADFSGQRVVTRINDHHVSNKLATEMNDNASSAINKTGFAVAVFADSDGGGSAICIDPHSRIVDFAAYAFNDVASSSKVMRSRHCVH